MTGTPQLLLKVGNDDRTARYQQEMGKALLFAYTVVEDDADTDGVSIAANQLSLNGGSYQGRRGQCGVAGASTAPSPPLAQGERQDNRTSPAAPSSPAALNACAEPPTSLRHRQPYAPAQAAAAGGFGPAPVAPSFVDGFRATRAVAENTRPGDAVGNPVSATHPDDLEITYSLSGTDAASFTVDEETGQISVKVGIDLTIGMNYTVNLTATDSAGFGAIIIVMIEVAAATHHAYDLNRNGVIDRDEIIKAVGDYFDGEITKDTVIPELIRLYFA